MKNSCKVEGDGRNSASKYIDREPTEEDSERYQTIFAKEEGVLQLR